MARQIICIGGGGFGRNPKQRIIENYILDYILDNLTIIEKSMLEHEKKVKEEKQAIKEKLKLFKECNASCIVFAEVSGSIQGDPDRKLSTKPQMDNDEWKSFCEKISEIGKYLEGEGMPLAYHHHMGTVIETQKDTERLLENTDDSVKLTLDTGHMLFAQGDSKKF